jgi:hypothetical protein
MVGVIDFGLVGRYQGLNEDEMATFVPPLCLLCDSS